MEYIIYIVLNIQLVVINVVNYYPHTLPRYISSTKQYFFEYPNIFITPKQNLYKIRIIKFKLNLLFYLNHIYINLIIKI